MDLVTLDFETATSKWDSPCELGIAVVRGGVVRDVRSWLIKPKQWPFFSPYNVAVHGIRPEAVSNAPLWPEVWAEAAELMQGMMVVAHNAGFDMGVIRHTLVSHNMSYPELSYFCSVGMAKRVWPNDNGFGLGVLCSRLGIPLQHHRAGNDAEATAEVVLRAAEIVGATSVTELVDVLRLKQGRFSATGHRSPSGKFTPCSPVEAGGRGF